MTLLIQNSMRRCWLLAAWLGAGAGSYATVNEPDPTPILIRVEAGRHDRVATPVSVAIGPERANWVLTDPTGAIVPHQVSDKGRLLFRTGTLARGSDAVLTYGPPEEADGSATEATIVHYDTEAIRFSFAGSDLVSYRVVPPDLTDTGIDPLYRRAGFLHPLKTLQGRTVTDAYPPDHLHQDGIWTAWSRTRHEGRRVDFWNLHRGTGRVDVLALDHAWDGIVGGGFSARHQFTDLTGASPEAVLIETWNTHVWTPDRRNQGAWFLDLTHEQVIDGEGRLDLLEHIYGGLAVRGHRDWLGEDNAWFLTADGISDRVLANETRTRWCAITGQVDGVSAGFAVLDHPDNPRSPQVVRIHPDMPYFCYGPVPLGPMVITPDQPYRASYRIVVFDGDPDPELLDRLWNDFADGPAVSLEAGDRKVE